MNYPYIIQPDIPVMAVVQGNDLVVTLPTAPYDRKLIRLNINGPAGAVFNLYKNSINTINRLDSTTRGDTNTADYSGGPIIVQRNSVLIGQWPNQASSTTPASATFYFAS